MRLSIYYDMEGEKDRLTFHDFELFEFYDIHMYYLYLKIFFLLLHYP